MSRIKYLLILYFLFTQIILFAQEQNNKLQIKLATGIATNEGPMEMGDGVGGSIGIEKQLLETRLRMIADFSNMYLTSKFIRDVPDMQYIASIIDIHGDLDLLRADNVALFAGLGVFGDYNDGHIGDWFNENTLQPIPGGPFHRFHFGGMADLGIRISLRKQKSAIDIVPITVYANNNFFIYFPKCGVDIKI